MTKRAERELFFKVLFITDFYNDKDEVVLQASLFLEQEAPKGEKKVLLSRLEAFLDALLEIDDIINDYAEGWKTSRIAKVDLTLLRMAIFEMKYEQLEKGIAINEAVELAKMYGEDRSYAFVNGILSKVNA